MQRMSSWALLILLNIRCYISAVLFQMAGFSFVKWNNKRWGRKEMKKRNEGVFLRYVNSTQRMQTCTNLKIPTERSIDPLCKQTIFPRKFPGLAKSQLLWILLPTTRDWGSFPTCWNNVFCYLLSSIGSQGNCIFLKKSPCSFEI